MVSGALRVVEQPREIMTGQPDVMSNFDGYEFTQPLYSSFTADKTFQPQKLPPRPQPRSRTGGAAVRERVRPSTTTGSRLSSARYATCQGSTPPPRVCVLFSSRGSPAARSGRASWSMAAPAGRPCRSHAGGAPFGSRRDGPQPASAPNGPGSGGMVALDGTMRPNTAGYGALRG